MSKVKYVGKLSKLNKVDIQVENQVKVDGRSNNTGRPVNKKSSRQIRLRKQRLYSRLNKQFVSGKYFKINTDTSNVYVYNVGEHNSGGSISDILTGYVCNVTYIGRTKVLGFTFVMGKRVNVAINLKQVKYVK